MKISELIKVMIANDSNNRLKKARNILADGLVKKIKIEKDSNFGSLDIFGVVNSNNYFGAYRTNISINLRTKNIIYTECDCTDYIKNCDFNNNYICEHIGATFYKFVQEAEDKESINNQKSIEKRKDSIGISLIEDIDRLENRKHDIVRLEVYLTRRRFFSGPEFYEASFKIGNKKMFVLKNINDFINARENEVPLEYGKTFTYDPLTQYFTDEDEKIIDFIEEYCSLNTAVNNSFSYRGGSSSIARNKTLLIPNQALNRFLKCCIKKNIYYIDGENTISLGIKKEELPINFTLSEINEDIRLKADDNIPEPFNIKGDVFLYKDNLYLPPKDQIKKYMTFYNVFLESDTITFKENKNEVFNKIIPTLDSITTNLKLDKKLQETIIKEDLKIEFYLDRDKKFTWVNVKLIYGNTELDFFEEVNSDKYIIRNKKKEHTIEDVLADLLFFRDKNKFIFTGDEEELFDFLCNDLKELKELGEVFYSDRFKDRKVYGTGSIKATVSENAGKYLEFTFEVGNSDEKETKKILQAFKEKRKFYKLKNDSFIDLEDDDIVGFFNLLDTLATDNRMLDNTIKIDRSRAMYLNNVIEEDGLSFVEGKEVVEHISNKINSLEEMEFKLPKGLKTTLRDYQITGFKWFKTLSHFEFGGILADEMGLGKTIQTIAFLLSETGKRTLIVTPTSLIYNWKSEFEKFAPTMKVLVFHGSKEERMKAMDSLDEYDVILTTYGTLRNDFGWYENKVFDYCIIDEAQNIKNPLALSSETVKDVKANMKFALTGTPIENSLMELWSIFDFIMPGYLYGKTRFLEKFTGKQENINTLKKLIRPFILRRIKKDVIKELPDKIEKKFYVEMTENQRKVYSTFVEYIKEKMDSKDINKDKITIFSYITKLRQLCLDPAVIIENYNGGSAKVNVTMEIVQDAIDNGHKILLFSQFTSVLDQLKKNFEDKKIKYYYIDGSTKAIDRLKLVDEFNNDNEIKLFLISLKAGGTGLNLTSADMVIHFDPWWNPAIEDQATDRAHRLGQKKVVEVIKLIAKGTIEEKIIKLQENKKEIIGEIMDGNYKDGSLLSSLNEEEIKALFT